MNIAVLSGKGGTGKTTVATNLACVLKANYVDCDVEEPNGFIFLKPKNLKSEQVEVDYPYIDQEKCTLCGECTRVCQFNALFRTKQKILHFEKLCHGCHACGLVCLTGAVTFKKRPIGVIEEGMANNLICKRGILGIGEPMAVPVIRQLLEELPEGINLLDCSPGTSCNAVNSLHFAQAVILVTEPSAFGLHDLQMAVDLVRRFQLPFGVVINKWNGPGSPLEEYLQEEGIIILGRLPYNREAAKVYSAGGMLKDLSEYGKAFEEIAEQVKEVFRWN